MKKIWLWLLAHRPRIRPRTLVLCTLAVLAFCIPTLLALSSVYLEPSAPKQIHFSVSIYDEHHDLIATEVASENPEDGATAADILYRAITTAKKTSTLPFDTSDGTPLYITANHNGVITSYTFYFSVLNNASFYIDTNNAQCFLIDGNTAQEFLGTTYAESLYNRSEPPVLYTNLQTAITPSAASWYYRTTSDNFRRSSSITATDALKSYEFSGALSLSFSQSPDVCSVRIIDRGALIYEGDLSGLYKITTAPGITLRIHVHARWDSTDGAFSYGELSYDFDAVIVDRATFFLDRQALSEGQFLLLTCKNIKNPSALKLTSTASLETYYYRYDTTTYCVIPYPESASADSFSLSLLYGASEKTFTVTLSPAANPQMHTLNREDNALIAAMSKEVQEQLKALPTALPSAADSTLYFQGNILSNIPESYHISYRFGDRLISQNGAAESTAIGNLYLTDSYGAPVGAVLSGEIATTGYSDSLGNYVVIHHGLGIYSWYGHLSAIDVRVGQIVATGQSIGKAGTGGVCDGEGFLLAFSSAQRFCDPNALLIQTNE